MGTPVCERDQGVDLGLSIRQKAVLVLVGQGKTNKEIAERLDLCNDTVKQHLRLGYRKLGATDRTQAVMFALQRGEIRLGDMDTGDRDTDGYSAIIVRGLRTKKAQERLRSTVNRANEDGAGLHLYGVAGRRARKPRGTFVVFKEFA